ncbi:MAG: RHS repeat-associated core domain-containing protein, partial [bacterium]
MWQPGAFDNNGGDRLVLRERDLDGDPLGVFEERVCFLQNARGDVVAVYSAGDGGDNKRVLLERVRYTEYGEPMCYAAADVNLDGRVDGSDESAWLALLQMGGMNPVTGEPDRRMDLNGDGEVTQADFALWGPLFEQACKRPNEVGAMVDDGPFNGVAEGGVLTVPTRRGTHSGGGTWVMHGVDNRFGFAGYMWDPFLKLYHVRHRVYDPMGGRWLQRDPIGMAGGWNLYQYCGGEPWGYVDPMGLEGITIGEFFSALGTELWGHQGFVASFSDGVGGLFDGTASDVVAAAAVQAEINTAARTGGEVTETGVAMTLLAQFIGAQDIATAVTGYDANVDGIVDTTDRVAAGLR